MIELFSARVCPYAQRTRLVLGEKGIDFTLTEIDLANKPARFLAHSPYGKVPALVHDGETLYESLIINEYLDEVFPEPPLMPAAPVLRARARIWNHYCDSYFTPDWYALIRTSDAAEQARLREGITERLHYVEERAFGQLSGEGPYWFGAEPTLADFAWYPFFERLPAWTHYRGVTLPEDCPRLLRWLEAMRARPSVRAIANPPEFYIERYARYAQPADAA